MSYRALVDGPVYRGAFTSGKIILSMRNKQTFSGLLFCYPAPLPAGLIPGIEMGDRRGRL